MLKKEGTWSTIGIVSTVLVALLVFSAWSWQAADHEADTSAVEATNPVEVTVTEDSLAIQQSAELQSGSVTFEVTNEGNAAHGFAISGPVEKRLEGEVAADEEQTLQVNLEPGTYMAYCPIEGHRESESAEFTVGR